MRPFYFKPVLVVIFIAMCMNTFAQSSYRFESTTSGYADLSNAKTISFKLIDNLSGFYRLKELDGELFKWYNVLFKIDTIKTFHIQPYANLRFDNDSSLIIVDGGFTYLDSIDATSSISYVIEGTPGDRLIKTQWKNLKIRVGKAGNFVNVQIWIYQKSGIMEIHFGPVSANNQSGFTTSTGPQVGIFYSRDDFTKCYEKLWIKGAPANIKQDSAANYAFSAMSGVPSEGVVFRFIPRFGTLGFEPHYSHNSNSFTCFPNPVADGWLNLSEEGDYEVYDFTGNEVLRIREQKIVDVRFLARGIYFIKDSGRIKGKFIVE